MRLDGLLLIQNSNERTFFLLYQYGKDTFPMFLSRADIHVQAMIDKNHAHLVNLGVSHPSLETIRAKTASEPYKLSTKLTGAGGGGCAVTLLPDSESKTRTLRVRALNSPR